MQICTEKLNNQSYFSNGIFRPDQLVALPSKETLNADAFTVWFSGQINPDFAITWKTFFKASLKT